MARKTETDYHQRSRAMVARYLGGDPRLKKTWGPLMCSQAALECGTKATFYVIMRDEQGNAVRDAQAEFTVVQPSGQTLTARTGCDVTVPGQYAMSFVPTESGEHSVKVKLVGAKETKLEQTEKYLVSPSRQELLDLRPEAGALAQLAKAGGGRAAPLAEHASLELPEPGNGRRAQRVVLSVWQSPGLLIVLLGVLCIEWLMRKRRGLA